VRGVCDYAPHRVIFRVRRNAFTLIEIAISVFIILLLLLLAVPSLSGVLADRRLRRSLDDLNKLVRQAQELSVNQHRAYLIVWGKNTLALQPEEFQDGEEEKPTSTLKMHIGDSFQLEFPAALVSDPAAEWIFWPSGNCEPAIVKYKGVDGTWSALYSSLTARPSILNYAVR
jgi:type II secretory pathway pseudopilin PulG